MAEVAARPASGLGLATVHASGQVLDAWFPAPALDGAAGAPHGVELERLTTEDADREVTRSVVRTVIDLDAPPADVPDAYLRLHLLSQDRKSVV